MIFCVSALITPKYLIFSYNECRLTLVTLGKSPLDGRICSRLNSCEPKIITFEADGPPGRRFQRRLCSNETGDMVCYLVK